MRRNRGVAHRQRVLRPRERGLHRRRRARYGCFEIAARGGTIFLDEIGNLPWNGQKALLRTLKRTIRRLGGTKSIKLDLRVIAATNDDLKEQAKVGGFREDLLFRFLAEYVITVPPLRCRPEDIPFLARRFLTQAREALGRPPVEIAPAALDRLGAYRWPGNARELRNVMRRAALTASRTITADDLAVNLDDGAAPATPTQRPLNSASLRDRLQSPTQGDRTRRGDRGGEGGGGREE